MDQHIKLPNVKELISQILEKKYSDKDKKQTKSINGWVEKDIEDRKERREKWDKNEKFFWLVQCFLARAQSPPNLCKPLLEYVQKIENINEESIIKAIEEYKKRDEYKNRWGNEITVKIIEDAKKVLHKHYKDDCEIYFDKAEKEFDEFIKADKKNGIDHFLEIKGIGLKLRDYALSDFSEKYLAVDTNLLKALNHTGLILYKYPYKISLRLFEIDYKNIQQLCLKFASELNKPPQWLDRVLFHFGKEFCDVKNCNVSECLTCRFKNE